MGAGLQSRPGTALVLDHLPTQVQSTVRSTRQHDPEVLRVDEDVEGESAAMSAPMRSAALALNVPEVTRLLQADADPNEVLTEAGDALIHMGARKNILDFVRLCAGFDGDLDAPNATGDTALHLSAEGGHAVFAKQLVELGVVLDPRNGDGFTPLHLAAKKGHTRVALYLIAQKANVQATTALGDTVVELAQRCGYHEIVLALCTAGASLRPGTGTSSKTPPKSPDARS